MNSRILIRTAILIAAPLIWLLGSCVVFAYIMRALLRGDHAEPTAAPVPFDPDMGLGDETQATAQARSLLDGRQ